MTKTSILPKPEKLRKVISEVFGIFDSKEFFELLLFIFVTNYWFIEVRNDYSLMFLIPLIILLIGAGKLAHFGKIEKKEVD